MEKRIFIGCITALLYSTLAMAATKTAEVSWEYDTPPTDLAGFRLFMNTEQVCDFSDPVIRESNCEINITSEETSFTMRAYDTAGNESVDSQPFLLNLPPQESPYNVNIIININ